MAVTTLLSQTITTALTNDTTGGVALMNLDAADSVALQCNFTYGSGGTTAKFYVQTSLDGGTTWFDIACFSYTTASGVKVVNLSALTPVTTPVVPASASLTANTVIDGILGDRLRVLTTTTGTYAGSTTVVITAVPH